MSRFKLPNNRIIQVDQPFELDGKQYLNGIRKLPPEERIALGIVEIIDQPRPDERFYFITEDPANPGQWIVTPKPLAPLKQQAKDRVKEIAFSKIKSKVPEWKQWQMLFRGLELTFKKANGGTLTAPETAAMQELASEWARIKAFWQRETALVAEIDAITTLEQMAAWTDTNWPEPDPVGP